MRLTDLLGKEVVDDGSRSLGRVRDVRLRVTKARAGQGPSLEMDGLIIGSGAVAERLGYAYGSVEGPWILKIVLGRIGRRARIVGWDQVVSVGDRVVITDVRSVEHPRETGKDDDR